jgi:hypothetical protein
MVDDLRVEILGGETDEQETGELLNAQGLRRTIRWLKQRAVTTDVGQALGMLRHVTKKTTLMTMVLLKFMVTFNIITVICFVFLKDLI